MQQPYNVTRQDIAIDLLHENPWNPNEMGDRVYEAEKESIRTYGMIDPILVRPHPAIEGEYQIIDGEHRRNSCRDLGYQFIPCDVIHNISEANAKKLTIILNETRGNAQKTELSRLLADIKLDLGDDLILGLPYDPAELDDLVQLGELSLDDLDDEESPEGSGEEDASKKDELIEFRAKVDQATFDRLQDSFNLLQEGGELPKNKALAWGQVLGRLVSDYLVS